MAEPLPDFLLDGTLWDFSGQPGFPSRADFVEAVYRHLRGVQEHAPDIRPEEHWRPRSIVLRCPRVLVRYYCDPPGIEPSWREVELGSDDGASFTVCELFHKLHNAVIGDLRDAGHCYFEGLEFEEVTAGGVPPYRMVPGS